MKDMHHMIVTSHGLPSTIHWDLMGAFLFLSPEEIIIVEHFDFETMSTNIFYLLSNGFAIGVFFSLFPLLNWFEVAEEAQIALLFFLHFDLVEI